jgi:hypothetical protein
MDSLENLLEANLEIQACVLSGSLFIIPLGLSFKVIEAFGVFRLRELN